MKYELNQIIHADCMDIMKDIPDKYFELAIVDPPYGIGAGNMVMGKGISSKIKKSSWDAIPPDKKYFEELFRISQNQIIFGGNYFILPVTNSWIVWDKDRKKEISFSDGELIWTSFNFNLKIKKHKYDGFLGADTDCRIHKCQKPIALYRWLLQNYAKPGDKIIDTHSGSGSLACACHLEKFEFLAIEKDEDYYKSSVERLETLRSQGVLF